MAEELEAHAGGRHNQRHQRCCQRENHPDSWSIEDALQGEGILHLRQGRTCSLLGHAPVLSCHGQGLRSRQLQNLHV